MSRSSPYVVDPADPRAPPMEIWETLSPEERAQVVASLPSEIPAPEALPPEGDAHFNAKAGTKSTLEGYFRKLRRRVYLACELPVYYPGERLFAPDLMAVLDVEDLRERERWAVAAEGRGLDLALEVHVAGDRRKDLVANAERYARLGISEYFIFDRGRLRLTAYRLAPGATVYEPIVPQAGRFESEVLELELAIDGTRLRFFHGSAPVLAADEWSAKLEAMLDQVEARALAAEERLAEEQRHREEERRLREEERRLREEERRLREEERRLREEEQLRRERAETLLAEALAELKRLERSR